MLANRVKGKKKIFYNHTEVERENWFIEKGQEEAKMTKKITSKISLAVRILENKKS